MSRVGKKPVAIPSGVDVQMSGTTISAKGKLGALSFTFDDRYVTLEVKDGMVHVIPLKKEEKHGRAMWGTSRRNVENMIKGVSEGYQIDLEMVGTGYRASVQGKDLVVLAGYSHEVRKAIPQGITVTCPKQTEIEIKGFDKQALGEFAANVRAIRPPEPYKGKGIKYKGEHIVRKEGKKK